MLYFLFGYFSMESFDQKAVFFRHEPENWLPPAFNFEMLLEQSIFSGGGNKTEDT